MTAGCCNHHKVISWGSYGINKSLPIDTILVRIVGRDKYIGLHLKIQEDRNLSTGCPKTTITSDNYFHTK